MNNLNLAFDYESQTEEIKGNELPSLGDIYGKDANLLVKYPEPHDKNVKYAYDADPTIPAHTIIAEGQRYFPLNKDVKVMLEEGTLDPNLLAYYKEGFEGFDGENLIEYQSGQMADVVNEFKGKTLSVLHPYDAIEEEKYITSPEKVEWLNDKHNLDKISSKVPQTLIESLPYSRIKDISIFPSVLKSGVSSSGDGVVVLKTKEDLQEALEKFGNYPDIVSEEGKLLLQQYIEPDENVSVQMSVSANGEISFIGTTNQLTEGDNNEYYLGNIVNNDGNDDQELIKIGYEIAENAKKMGYVGLMGIDVLIENGQYYVIDGNFRLTGCSTSLLLKDKDFSEFDKLYTTSYNAEGKTINQVLGSVGHNVWKIISSVTSKEGDITKGHIVIWGKEVEEMKEKIAILNEKGIKIEFND